MKSGHNKKTKSGYLTRTQAIRHLQVSLADFRRLCILKGIYPREITSKKEKHRVTKGSTKHITAYYRKDIQYLLHEPLLQKFRDHKIFAKRLNRALGRGDKFDAIRIDANRPRYTLDHIIKERYPTFIDALGDLDDALCMIYLFALMPATDKVSHRITQDAERLGNEWAAYIAREGLLRKVFVSIKGVYYQANVKGQDIMWLVPFKFPQNVPTDIDFRIMLTFLEFYTTLLHFVLYRLYTESGLVYPPVIKKDKLKGVGGLSAYLLESNKPTSALPAVELTEASRPAKKIDVSKIKNQDLEESSDEEEVEEETEQFDEFENQGDDGDILLQPSNTDKSQLFSNFTFFIGREVPLDICELVLTAFGGKVISEARIDELIDNEDENSGNQAPELNLKNVTHQICDRPAISHKVPGRVYIQPQWIFDSVNKGELLPVGQYAPGETLPPHLSPWGDRGTYDPETKRTYEEAESESEIEENGEEDVEEEEQGDEEEEAQKELQMEAKGIKFSENTKADKKKKSTSKKEDEEKELRKLMMSGKKRKLYEKMQYSNDKKKAREETLNKKRRKIEKLKAKLQ